MKNLKTFNQARQIAEQLIALAEENEPNITADLQNIASEVSAEMVGLENRFKSEESLIRKLIDYVGDDFQRLKRKAETVNDVLRYTFILPLESYAEKFHETRERLSELGYRIPENRIWNAWQTIGESFDRGYRGINITVNSSKKQNFELQFHTEESFRLKTETHYLYDELRRKDISRQRKTELIERCINAAENVQRPKGV